VEIVVSEPRDREILMEAVGCGYFHAFVEDIAAGALYRYRLNDEKERPDPAARSGIPIPATRCPRTISNCKQSV
jgi:1,4-alpha-glucan branching enzyme